MSRVAIILNSDGSVHSLATDGKVAIYAIDNNSPNDRVYQYSLCIERMTKTAMSELLGEKIENYNSKPNVNQAIAAKLQTKPNGKPNISLVENSHD